MQYLTFALTKGRLADKTMDLLEKAGFSCEEMKDKDTRKLIFTNEEQKLRFFLAKGPDVPTYVEYGAADIGVVGSDVIMEEKEGSTKCWIWDSASAACVCADQRRPVSFSSTTR